MKETDGRHILACKRVKAAKVWHVIPPHYIEALERNQLIASCCRHPENHEIEAWFSSPRDAAEGNPDIYKFHCSCCGNVHTRFCIGDGDLRPIWRRRWFAPWRLECAQLVGKTFGSHPI